MKTLKITQFLLLTLMGYTFSACMKHEKISSIESMETIAELTQHVTLEKNNQETTDEITKEKSYGDHTDEIEAFLSATPIGAEIYLEQKESGEWYLKIEKTFTATKELKKTETIEPIYGESILI